MPNTKRVRILIYANLVVMAVAFLPGFVGSGYSESGRLYAQGVATVWLLATNLYMLYALISAHRQGLVDMRKRHQRELAELAERHQPAS